MKINFTLILCVFCIGILSAQNDVDSLFSKARERAFDKDYQAARAICSRILILSPGYVDAAVLSGRTYSWQGQYDSAKVAIKVALDRKPAYYDAISAMIDAYSWGDDYKGAIYYCNYGLQKHPADKEFTIKKVKMMKNNKEYALALQTVDSMLLKQPNNDTLTALKYSIRLAKVANKLSVSYTLDVFEYNSPSPWQLAYIQYSRKTPWGSAIARVNYGSRFGTKGVQCEVDAYPSLGKKMYGYLNYGFSEASIFPKQRFGAEVYRSLPHSYEVSLGLRHLRFSSSSVTIYTAYIGKYIGNEWLSLRTYVTPSNDGTGTSASGSFVIRHYFQDGDTYIGIGGGLGSSPDDRARYYESSENIRLKSNNIKLNFSKKIYDFWIANLGFAFENQNYNSSSQRKDYTFDISLTHLF